VQYRHGEFPVSLSSVHKSLHEINGEVDSNYVLHFKPLYLYYTKCSSCLFTEHEYTEKWCKKQAVLMKVGPSPVRLLVVTIKQQLQKNEFEPSENIISHAPAEEIPLRIQPLPWRNRHPPREGVSSITFLWQRLRGLDCDAS
jgi:hypothetical protein